MTDSSIQHPRILVVDDNELTAKTLVRVLESAGYVADTSHCGGDALKYARLYRCSAALIDIHLPDLNGLVVAKEMRELWGAEVPIIIISGDTSMEVINALSHIGATYFFNKPLNVPYLLERMREWINPQ